MEILSKDFRVQERDLVLTLTYAVVVFSILVQGLSIGKVVRDTVSE